MPQRKGFKQAQDARWVWAHYRDRPHVRSIENGCRNSSVSPNLQALCSVTDELADAVDPLLTPDLYNELKCAQKEVDDPASRIVQTEKDMARQEGVEHVEFELESEEWGDNLESYEIAQAAAVDARPREDNTMAKKMFAGGQRDDVSLEGAWEQARAG
ncbi:hypothetical protein HPB48_012873 [Haemaphysalis longicornis]|uniref:Uncharacterized protein n=1 Tax=Haemaphysalis longicornis TaxID=44386 RepID=A0A9J6GCD0_HAELO|nr:hypothetical protein HPB48_012873 [Haemaphysalis longicornis]